jgi:methyltransferase (TIGR00027 family)
MGRAVAHAATSVAKFSDPTAIELLPTEARARVERLRSGASPHGLRDCYERRHLSGLSNMMVARTVEIDEAVRGAMSAQVVILGAGLDGRAWRMPELRDVVVFEVDHPDSQREKRARVARLTRSAREVRFVPVDFERDRLDDALESAGHDPALATTWIWEGVVMYLALRDIEATLSVVERRSARHSRLIVAYHSPALMLRLVGLAVRRLGEPLRSSFTADSMRALLGKYHFTVVRDEILPAIGARLSDEVGRATKIMKHLRIATADRTPMGNVGPEDPKHPRGTPAVVRAHLGSHQ